MLITVCTDFVNILLVGCGDLRHVLTTLAKAHKHSDKPIHVSFFVIVSNIIFCILYLTCVHITVLAVFLYEVSAHLIWFADYNCNKLFN